MEQGEQKNGNTARPPGDENWTAAQWRAITADGKHMLVSAGAGAGKTRVLIRRILERICRTEEPLGIDRLLVVTFTNAAAGEMKKRLAAALEERIRQEPRSGHLRRQLLLLNKAQISTVHSFCLEVIREYYHLIGLDPSFRMLDQGEALLLQQDLLEELLEDHYAGQALDSPFYRLVESRSGVRGDLPLQDLVLRLYRFAWSHPEPENWLQQQAAAFAPAAGEGALQPWLKILQEDCRRELTKLTELLRLALETAGRPGGPAPYRDNLETELQLLESAVQASFGSWETFAAAVQEISFDRLKSCRGDAYDDSLRTMVTNLRDGCKKDLASLKEQFFSRTLAEQEAELQRLAPQLQTLAELVQDFHVRYRALKHERGVADFNDLEHFALQILRHPASPPGRPQPSEAALAYRERFDGVLVDEYQDINQLQETIISLVSREEPGNLFMVGDVKQSIYRFRLAEPELFLSKYNIFNQGSRPGLLIPLAHNFRSREEVIDSVNFLFQQLMDENVGEIAYDEDAMLRCGAVYPQAPDGNDYKAEMLFLTLAAEAVEDNDREDHESGPSEQEREDEWELASLEGKLIARRIKALRGEEEGEPLLIYHKETGVYAPPQYRNMVILLRSYQNCAPAILEELQRSGIPAYAELATGYFAATEVEVMLSLLKVIDNPYQDIPMAAVLRSPLVGLGGEELAKVRLAAPRAPYYEAIKTFVRETTQPRELSLLREKLELFLEELFRWRENAQQESLGELIWQLYRDSGYYDMLGAMPGGRQRQANLRALYDRARQYEATSFRGLSRFLRFVERLQERGADLGAARALGEQEDVVRIITVHKSKGLEFPVVFVAGLSRRFNLQDLGRDFLLHKELGFGPKYIDPELRLTYPTLPWLALRKHLHLETLAEELRILYVALTRAEQKLVLVAGIKDLKKAVQQWQQQARQKEPLLPSHARAAARSFTDWLGPALLRHPSATALRELADDPEQINIKTNEKSDWTVKVASAAWLCAAETAFKEAAAAASNETIAALQRLEPLPRAGGWEDEVERRLSWTYPHRSASRNFAKLSVSALQRLQKAGFHGEDGEKPEWSESFDARLSNPPRFLSEAAPGAAAQGTAYHMVLQCLDLTQPLDEQNIMQQLSVMVKNEQLTAAEQEMVDPCLVASFFQNPLGQRLINAQKVWRELPFTMVLPATQLYPEWQDEDEQIFIQGVIDCLFEEGGELVLIDYKLGGDKGSQSPGQEYGLQLYYYGLAVRRILNKPVKEAYIYFIKRREILKIEV